jgi:hypothetical protein
MVFQVMVLHGVRPSLDERADVRLGVTLVVRH